MPGIVPLVLTTIEDQSLIVHVKSDTSILVLLNVQLVIALVIHVVELPTIVPHVKVADQLMLNQLVLVYPTNSLTTLVLVKLVLTDVPLVL